MKLKVLFALSSLVLASCGDRPSGGSINCPRGYAGVAGNGSLGTDSFCVMVFEAKNVKGVPVSQAAKAPWINISAIIAQEECESVTSAVHKGKFALMSNPEWMTIARDIEKTAANWSGDSAGSGHIPRGHSDGFPRVHLAVTDTRDPYDGTGNSSADAPGSGWEQKRTHTLSTGGVLWDFSGNIAEWVDWDAGKSDFTSGPTDGTRGWNNFPTLGGSLKAHDLLPAKADNDHTRSFGRWLGERGGAAYRGGTYSDGDRAGIFTLLLDSGTTSAHSNIGFRCVYRP